MCLYSAAWRLILCALGSATRSSHNACKLYITSHHRPASILNFVCLREMWACKYIMSLKLISHIFRGCCSCMYIVSTTASCRHFDTIVMIYIGIMWTECAANAFWTWANLNILSLLFFNWFYDSKCQLINGEFFEKSN